MCASLSLSLSLYLNLIKEKRFRRSRSTCKGKCTNWLNVYEGVQEATELQASKTMYATS